MDALLALLFLPTYSHLTMDSDARPALVNLVPPTPTPTSTRPLTRKLSDSILSSIRSATSYTAAIPSLLRRAPGVRLTIINQTTLPLALAPWPIRSEHGEQCELQCFRGSGVIDRLLPEGDKVWEGSEGHVVDLGAIKRPDKGSWVGGNAHEEGWVRRLVRRRRAGA